jgi:hypothetical protein
MGSCRAASARPWAAAAWATATATVADTWRRSSTGAAGPPPGCWGRPARPRPGRPRPAWGRSCGPGPPPPQAQAGEDQGVVGLGDPVGDVPLVDRGEGAAGGDQGPPPVPGDQVGRGGLGPGGIRGGAPPARPATSAAGRAEGRWKSSCWSARSSVNSPRRPRRQNRRVASSRDSPWPTMTSRSMSAMPSPAVPAPWTTPAARPCGSGAP